MSKHLTVVNTQAEAKEAEKNLEEPFVILVKDGNKLVYQDDTHCDAVLLIDDWNNYHAEIPVVQKDISWIKGRRCLVKKTADGVAICYLDENNSELFHDGTTVAKLDGSMGQWMTDLPEFNIQCTEGESDWVKLHISRDKEIGHKSRRVLVGVTKAVNRNGKLWSCKHPLNSTSSLISTDDLTAIQSHNYANALGSGFDIIDYESHCKVAYMFMAKYKSKDPQSMEQFGLGENSPQRTLGTTSSLGNKDGHTNTQIAMFGIEDWYGCKREWMGGIHSNTRTYYIYDGFEPDKVPTVPYRTIETNPGTTHMDGTFKEVNEMAGYISRMMWGEHADLIMAENSGTDAYFYSDYSSVGYDGWKVVFRSDCRATKGDGLFYFSSGYESLFHDSNMGSRIQYRGKIEVIDDPQEFIALPVGM